LNLTWAPLNWWYSPPLPWQHDDDC